MSLSVEDFVSEFEEGEFKEIPLTTWPGEKKRFINLRGIPYALVKKFQSLSEKVAGKKALNTLSGGGDIEDYEESLDRGNDHLLKIACCDDMGKPLFDDEEVFRKWKSIVPAGVVNEILIHIELMNQLYGGFEGMDEVIEAYKKK